MTPTTTTSNWDELIKSLNSSHICNVKKVVVQGMDGVADMGLEVYAPKLRADGIMDICKEVCGEGYSVYFLPNNETVYIDKMIK